MLSLIKVFARLFQKAAQWRARSPPRAPQSAKLPGIFFFVDCPRRVLPRQSVFFCASGLKRKKRLEVLKLQGIAGICAGGWYVLLDEVPVPDVGEEPAQTPPVAPPTPSIPRLDARRAATTRRFAHWGGRRGRPPPLTPPHTPPGGSLGYRKPGEGKLSTSFPLAAGESAQVGS